MTAILSLLIIIFCIYLLAIITDEYFIECLEVIAEKWELPSNVAAASLMAMGSSMPELAVAFIALIKGGEAHDIGIGNIVGSAVFNILVITGASAVVRPAKVTWQVVTRDTVVYLISILLLLFAFWDKKIQLWEAGLFLLLYTSYIVLLFQWKKIAPNAPDIDVSDEEEEEEEEEKEGEAKGIYARVTEVVSSVIGLLTGPPRETYNRAFLVSVALIAGISWFLVEYAVIFANEIGIPPLIVALTIIAGGSSVPDLIASLIVAGKGRGEAAIANAIGSNIFDITVGLGLPWLILLIAKGGGMIEVGTDALMSSTLVLLATVGILYFFLFTGWVLSRIEGYILLAIYVAYVIAAWLGFV